MSQPIAPNLRAWLAEPMPPDVRRTVERMSRATDVQHVAIMPDVHLAKDVCVGTVVATTRLIYPAAVGGDIGCGVAAAAFDAPADLLSDVENADRLLRALPEALPIIRHGPRTRRPLPPHLTDLPLSHERLNAIRRRDGVVQFGTLGRGNHFLEFQGDDEGCLWLMVHSGSRAMGQATRDFHVARAAETSAGLASLDSESGSGRGYLSDAEWARRYAAGNRRVMIESVSMLVAGMFGIRLNYETFFDCDHNHVQRETHFGCELWVHRKGAMQAVSGQAGIIPGSMGSESFHVEGRGNAESLCSSSHGAGRAMSREEARRRISSKELTRQMGTVVFDRQLVSSLREEAPAAYKDVKAVLRAQADLTRIVRRLRPLLCYKG